VATLRAAQNERNGAFSSYRLPMTESISIASRFNGPLDSGNGGYSAGMLATFLHGPAEINLRRPVPLDTQLDVVREDDGSVRMLAGGEVVADGRPAPGFTIDVPAPVSPPDAREASTRYRGQSEGVFSRCFVCGRAREDALGVFAGPVEGRRLIASPWTPPDWTADADGHVLPEFVWAVLDCPASFAPYMDREMPLSMLARFTVRIDAPVAAGHEHVVIGWPAEMDGRKHHAGSAVLSSDGTVLAAARALLIAPRDG
jgi:hypothetical protein